MNRIFLLLVLLWMPGQLFGQEFLQRSNIQPFTNMTFLFSALPVEEVIKPSKDSFTVYFSQQDGQVHIEARSLPRPMAAIELVDETGQLVYTYIIGQEANIRSIMPPGNYQARLKMRDYSPLVRKLKVR